MYEIPGVAATSLSQRDLSMLNETVFNGMIRVLVLKSQNIIEVCSKVFCLEEFFISKPSVICAIQYVRCDVIYAVQWENMHHKLCSINTLEMFNDIKSVFYFL